MIARLKQAFQSLAGGGENQPVPSQSLRLATAFLLIEVGRADNQWEAEEAEKIVLRVAEYFQLEPPVAEALVEQAKGHADDSVSLYDTVEILNQRCSAEEKSQILLDCWRVAFADGVLDKHEEHLIRQLSEWLYLSHKDFIQLKHKAEAEHGSSSKG